MLIEGFTGLEVMNRNFPNKTEGSSTLASLSVSCGKKSSKDLVDKEVRKGCFLSVNFSGPVRSAGTTAVCVFLILIMLVNIWGIA